MARMGRPPKPIEVKRRAGNPGKRALPAPVVALPAAVSPPEPPDGLSAFGQQFWSDVWSRGAAWLTPALDLGTVELAARLFDDIAAYRQEIADRGRVIEEPILWQGEVVPDAVKLAPNPAVKMLREAERSLLAYLIDLGFTPTARAKLGLTTVKAESKLEALARARAERQMGRSPAAVRHAGSGS